MTTSQSDSHLADRAAAIAVAERQLVLLEELGAMGMVVARAEAHAAVAAAHAVEVILADQYWQPETGRARALAGSKDAAEAFQKASRSLRLTFVLEKTVAEDLCDLRAGIPHKPRDAALTHPCQLTRAKIGEATCAAADRDLPDTDRPAAVSERAGANAERLYEFDRPDQIGAGGFKVTVNAICADIGAKVDWRTWAINTRPLDFKPLTPADYIETNPPEGYQCGKAPIAHPRDGALPP